LYNEVVLDYIGFLYSSKALNRMNGRENAALTVAMAFSLIALATTRGNANTGSCLILLHFVLFSKRLIGDAFELFRTVVPGYSTHTFNNIFTDDK